MPYSISLHAANTHCALWTRVVEYAEEEFACLDDEVYELSLIFKDKFARMQLLQGFIQGCALICRHRALKDCHPHLSRLPLWSAPTNWLAESQQLLISQALQCNLRCGMQPVFICLFQSKAEACQASLSPLGPLASEQRLHYAYVCILPSHNMRLKSCKLRFMGHCTVSEDAHLRKHCLLTAWENSLTI